MSIAFNIVLHLLLISSLVGFVVALGFAAFTTKDRIEQLIRSAAFVCGGLVVLGAQAAGVSYADFIVKSLGTVRPLSFGLAGAVFPALTGTGLGWYFTRTIKRSTNLGLRVLSFVGMLAATQFLYMYAAGTSRNGLALRSAAVPNIAFLVGLLLWVVLKWEPGAPQKGATSEVANRFRKMAGNRRKVGS